MPPFLGASLLTDHLAMGVRRAHLKLNHIVEFLKLACLGMTVHNDRQGVNVHVSVFRPERAMIVPVEESGDDITSLQRLDTGFPPRVMLGIRAARGSRTRPQLARDGSPDGDLHQRAVN